MANAVPDDLETGIRPLPAGTLDVGKLNDEARQRREEAMIRLLKQPIRTGENRAISARNEELLRLAKDSGSYWSGVYRDRFAAARADDELVTLIRRRLSRSFGKQVTDILCFTSASTKPKRG
jgi:hypothetical protein